MQQIAIGDVTITSIVERDGPWRKPEDMFPAYDPERGKRFLAELDPVVFDPATGKMVITYQTFVVRTPKHTILVDTCTGEDKGFPAPMDFPKQPWLDGFKAAGLRFEDVDYVFCTHLHIDHCGWNTRLVDGRWVPTFPKAKYVFHKGEYAAWEQATKEGKNPPGNVWRMNCEPVVAAGQALLVDDGYTLDDTVSADPDAGPFALPLLRRHQVEGPARHRHRRPDAPRDAGHGAGMAHHLRLGRADRHREPQALPRKRRGYRRPDPADPLPEPDRGNGEQRRAARRVQVEVP